MKRIIKSFKKYASREHLKSCFPSIVSLAQILKRQQRTPSPPPQKKKRYASSLFNVVIATV